MAINKAFSEDERGFIRRNWGWMTHGDMAKSINELYKPYNNDERTSDGVRSYIAEMTGGKAEVSLPRGIKDQLKDNGHDPAKIEKVIEQSVTKALKPLIEKQARSKAKAS